MGRASEAIASIRLAEELDPLSLIIGTALGRAFHFARQYDRAREQYLRTLEMDADFAEARFNLGLVNAQLSMFGEAAAEMERAMAIAGRRPVFLATLGYVRGISGERAQARLLLAELDRLAREGRIPTLYLAYPCIGLGEHDRAFAVAGEGVRRAVGAARVPQGRTDLRHPAPRPPLRRAAQAHGSVGPTAAV